MSEQPEQSQLDEELPAPDEVHQHREIVIEDHSEDPPRPARPNRGPRKSQTQVAAEVQLGKWGNPWMEHVEAAGYDPDFIADLIDRGVGKPKQ